MPVCAAPINNWFNWPITLSRPAFLIHPKTRNEYEITQNYRHLGSVESEFNVRAESGPSPGADSEPGGGRGRTRSTGVDPGIGRGPAAIGSRVGAEAGSGCRPRRRPGSGGAATGRKATGKGST